MNIIRIATDKLETNQSYKNIPSNNAKTLLTLIAKPQLYKGFVNGFRQSVATLNLQIKSFNLSQMPSFQKALNDYFEDYEMTFKEIQCELDLVQCLGEVVAAMQKAANYPIFEAIHVDELSYDDARYQLWIPYLHEECFHQAMAFALQLFLELLAMREPVINPLIVNEIADLIQYLKSQGIRNVNSLHLLKVAHQQQIPWNFLAQKTFQFGYGRHSRWFDSTFTDLTSHLGANIVKDKFSANQLLKNAGFPVTSQYVVRDEMHAIDIAYQIGFPIVIKPAHSDGGYGVSANIIKDHQIKKAFALAKQFSKIVLLEKQFVGIDYRLFVLDQKLVWAVERQPAGVTGNGKNNISELIEMTNHERRGTTLKKIVITDETMEYLGDQGFNLNSIPCKDQFIPLCRIANVSHGGVPRGVFHEVHPDNIRLAETIATLFRLDIAGIDFMISDIKESYLKTPSAIIEVNSQPQLGLVTAAHLYSEILTTLIPKHGRIPIIVICSHHNANEMIQKIQNRLKNRFQNIGIVKDRVAYINGIQINPTTTNFNAAICLLANPLVDALIYCVQHANEIENHGLPFDAYDYLFMLDFADIHNHSQSLLKNTLRKACQREVFNQHQLSNDLENNLNKISLL